MEKSVGWSNSEVLVMWNPPWTLPLILPLGMLDYDTAQLLWFLFHSVIIFVGAQILWQFYAGEPNKARSGLLSVLIFPPVYFALLLGQIGPVILLGIIGLFFFIQRKWWFFAGASLSLVSIKPHISYLLWIVVVLWVVRENHRKSFRNCTSTQRDRGSGDNFAMCGKRNEGAAASRSRDCLSLPTA